MLSLLLAACLNHACSNDSLTPPVVGDERIRWVGPVTWDIPKPCPDHTQPCNVPPLRCYQVERSPGGITNLCEVAKAKVKSGSTGLWWYQLQPPAQFFPYKVPAGQDGYPTHGTTYLYRVRACEFPNPGCSPWTEWVEFVGQPYQCWPGATNNEPGSGGCQ